MDQRSELQALAMVRTSHGGDSGRAATMLQPCWRIRALLDWALCLAVLYCNRSTRQILRPMPWKSGTLQLSSRR